jgi:hypothetical protein
MPGRFRLLLVNNTEIREVKYEDWGLAQVSSVLVPKGMDWRGSDQAWDEIMNGFKLEAPHRTEMTQ